MANIKSQIKRNKQNEKRRLRNRTVRGSARTAIKNAQTATLALHVSADATTKEESKASILTAISALDKAAKQRRHPPEERGAAQVPPDEGCHQGRQSTRPCCGGKEKESPCQKGRGPKSKISSANWRESQDSRFFYSCYNFLQ